MIETPLQEGAPDRVEFRIEGRILQPPSTVSESSRSMSLETGRPCSPRVITEGPLRSTSRTVRAPVSADTVSTLICGSARKAADASLGGKPISTS